MLPALPHLHSLLGELNRSATRKISFAPLAHGIIGDDEAVLLQLCRDASENPPRARATLALLLDEDAVGPGFNALLSGVSRLNDAGLGHICLAADSAVPGR